MFFTVATIERDTLDPRWSLPTLTDWSVALFTVRLVLLSHTLLRRFSLPKEGSFQIECPMVAEAEKSFLGSSQRKNSALASSIGDLRLWKANLAWEQHREEILFLSQLRVWARSSMKTGTLLDEWIFRHQSALAQHQLATLCYTMTVSRFSKTHPLMSIKKCTRWKVIQSRLWPK